MEEKSVTSELEGRSEVTQKGNEVEWCTTNGGRKLGRRGRRKGKTQFMNFKMIT